MRAIAHRHAARASYQDERASFHGRSFKSKRNGGARREAIPGSHGERRGAEQGAAKALAWGNQKGERGFLGCRRISQLSTYARSHGTEHEDRNQTFSSPVRPSAWIPSPVRFHPPHHPGWVYVYHTTVSFLGVALAAAHSIGARDEARGRGNPRRSRGAWIPARHAQNLSPKTYSTPLSLLKVPHTHTLAPLLLPQSIPFSAPYLVNFLLLSRTSNSKPKFD